jgi:hypothetical protein
MVLIHRNRYCYSAGARRGTGSDTLDESDFDGNVVEGYTPLRQKQGLPWRPQE